MKWETVKLGDISQDIQTGPFGSQLHQSDYSETGTPVVMPKDLVDGMISEHSIARVNEAHVQRLKRHIIQKGDILYSRRGDVGRCAYATEKNVGWLCGTGCLRVRLNAEKANPKFVFFHLQHPETVGWVEKHAIGATMPNLNTSILSNVPLSLPPLDTQHHITAVLSSYDDLIANNQKQIKLLEEAAQRLYKEWFVDLHFPGYENTPVVDGVPEGWKKSVFSDVFEFTRGKSYTSSELSDTAGVLFINLKNIKAFGGYNYNTEKRFVGTYKQSQLLTDQDIIMGVTDMTQERRLVGHVALVPKLKEKAIFSMDLIRLTPFSVSKYYLYSALRYGQYSEQIAALANGVNVLHLKPDAMMGMQILIPDAQLLNRYDRQYSPIQRKMELLQEQCDLAIQARDRLLPKLMSGEVEV